MYEYVYIGSSPAEEECAQVGAKDYDYSPRARKECRAYINQLTRIMTEHGYVGDNIPKSFSMRVKSESHDYGSYYEVVCRVTLDQVDSEKAWDLALFVEEHAPTLWDEQAKKELNIDQSVLSYNS